MKKVKFNIEWFTICMTEKNAWLEWDDDEFEDQKHKISLSKLCPPPVETLPPGAYTVDAVFGSPTQVIRNLYRHKVLVRDETPDWILNNLVGAIYAVAQIKQSLDIDRE